MLSVETPSSARVREVLDMLCMGRNCSVEAAAPADIAPGDYVATYRTVEGELLALWVLPLDASAHIAAAMGAFPRSRAQDCVKTGSLDSSLLEVLVEVGNVLGVLVNGPGSVRLRFSGVLPTSGLPSDTHAFLASAQRRAGFAVAVDDAQACTATVVLMS